MKKTKTGDDELRVIKMNLILIRINKKIYTKRSEQKFMSRTVLRDESYGDDDDGMRWDEQ